MGHHKYIGRFAGSAIVGCCFTLVYGGTCNAQTTPSTGIVKLAQLEGADEAPEPAATQEDFYALDVPVTLNQAYLGDITAEVTLSGYARISIARLKTLLEGRLPESQAAILDSFTDDLVLLEALRDQGFIIVYDPGSLTIKINLRREGAERVSVSGRTVENLSKENLQQPAIFSTGLGLIARPRYVHKSQSGDTGFAPMAADLRGFASVGGFKNVSLTYELNYQENRDTQIQRGDITLTRDDFTRAIRYQAGDIRPSITGFQSSLDILGIGIERNYGAIQPFRNLRPGGRSTFTLERQARVTYEVNGVTLGGRRLEAGDYDVRDFPLITGANDVRVIVDDEFGQREVASYSTFVDSDLLSADTVLFGLTAGVQRDRDSLGGNPAYSDDFTALGFYEKGISDDFTAGAQFEIGADGGFVGGRLVRGFGNNVVAFEGGVSSFDGFKTGSAAALRYSNRPFRGARKNYNQFDAQVSYQSRDFQTLGSNGMPRGEVWSAGVRDSFTKDKYSISVNASWLKSSNNELTTLGATVRRPFKGFSASLGYRGVYSKNTDKFDNRLLLTLSRNFGNYGSVRSRLATGPNEAELEWRRLSTRGVGAWSGRASYLSSEIEDEFSADASYIMSRAEFDIGHSTVFENGGGATISSVTDARVGVGIGFADGTFAFGRPVSDGFVIVKGHNSLDDRAIETFQSGTQKSGKTDMFGAALVPLTGSYREQIHKVNVKDLPPAYDIGSGQIQIFPSYNSGYKVKIGSDPAALVMGVLKSANGEPVQLTTGRLVPVGQGEAAQPIDFFTNRTGRFVAERVPPGTYQLILMPDDRLVEELEIGEGEKGVFRAGIIEIEEE